MKDRLRTGREGGGVVQARKCPNSQRSYGPIGIIIIIIIIIKKINFYMAQFPCLFQSD